MSVLITNNMNPQDVGTPSSGELVLFSGPNNEFYYKRPDGQYFRISNGGFNTQLNFNSSTYDLTVTDGSSTLTASLLSLSSGYFNTGASFSTASGILSITDGFGSVTTSLYYYEGGFNQTMSYNTSSNVLTITDGKGTLTASLTTGGANNLMTFNPFTNILEVTDGFGSVTASLALLAGSTTSVSPGGITGSFQLNDGLGGLTGLGRFDSFNNISIGLQSYNLSTTGGNNVSLGNGSLYSNTTGGHNVGLGFNVQSGGFTGSVILGSCAEATAGGQFSLGSANFPIGPTASESCTSNTTLQIRLNGNTYKLLLFK